MTAFENLCRIAAEARPPPCSVDLVVVNGITMWGVLEHRPDGRLWPIATTMSEADADRITRALNEAGNK